METKSLPDVVTERVAYRRSKDYLIDAIVESSSDHISKKEIKEFEAILDESELSPLNVELPDDLPTVADLFTKVTIALTNATLAALELFPTIPPAEIEDAVFNDLSVAGTPGSDPYQTGGDGALEFNAGREGNDVLLMLDPEKSLPGIGEIDSFQTGADRDRVILGDWRRAYYDDGDTTTIGDNDFALIVDFDRNLDVIQLHGTPSDYILDETVGGTNIYKIGVSGDVELIAGLGGPGSVPTGLDLNAPYFKFVQGQPTQVQQSNVLQIGTEGQDIGFSVHVANDGSGSVYVSGYTTGALGDAKRDAGSLEGFITKYDSTGKEQWTRQVGTSASDHGYGVTTDTLGNVYWMTRTNFAGDFAGSPNAGIGNDSTLFKFDSNGRRQWNTKFASFGNDNSFIDPKVDSQGNIIAAGYTNNDLFAENQSPDTDPNADPWLVKLDTNGNQLWAVQYGTETGDEAFSVALDSEDSSYTVGWTVGNFGAPNQVDSNGAPTYDIFMAKHDTLGNQEWIRQIGSVKNDWAWDVAVNNNDEIYLTGWTRGDLAGTNAGSNDYWIAKYDQEGNQAWVKQYGTAGDDTATGIEIDTEGNLFLTGFTNYDSFVGVEGDYQSWVAKFDGEGNPLWSQELGSSGYESSKSISVKDGSAYVTGLTDGAFGSANEGSYDAFIAKLSTTNGDLLPFVV